MSTCHQHEWWQDPVAIVFPCAARVIKGGERLVHWLSKRYGLVLAALLITALALAGPVAALEYTISNTGSTPIQAGLDYLAANSHDAQDTLILNYGTYSENNIVVGKSVTIRAADGHGPIDTIIDGKSASPRIFTVTDSAVTFTIDNLTLQNGRAPNGANGAGGPGSNGGAISSAGPVTVISSNITDCWSGSGGTGGAGVDYGTGGTGGDGGNGGAINGSTVDVSSSTIDGCLAGSGGTGGSGGTYGNGGGAGAAGTGGAIYATDAVTMTVSTITGCTAGNGGGGGNGGIGNGGTAPPGINGNVGGSGGALSSPGTVTVISSTISGCSAGNGGGGGAGRGGNSWGYSGGNGANGGNGGAIDAKNLFMTSTTITSCSAGNGGSYGLGGPGFYYSGPSGSSGASGTVSTIVATSGDLHHNRLYPTGGTPVVGSSGSLTSANNWWGSNANATGYVSGSVICHPWLVATTIPSPPSITSAQTSTLQASIIYNSDGIDTSGSGHIQGDIPVTFATSTGTVSPSSATLISGIASTTFTPSGTGLGLINSNIDGNGGMSVVTVTGGSGPVPVVTNFSGSPTTGTAPLTVDFADTSTGSPTSRLWTFGSYSTADEGISTGTNPSHTYESPGTYTVTLTANTTERSDSMVRTGYITVSPPGMTPITAGFTSASPLTGHAPLTVVFTDTSTGGPTSWLWSFGDGTTSTLRNPTNTYTTAGSYTITLTATNGSVSNTISVPAYVTVASVTTPVVASFANATPRTGTAPLTVTFTDKSTGGPVAWLWSFGDGSTSTDENPVHAYTGTGTYTVTLTAVNGTYINTLTQAGYVTVTAAGSTSTGSGSSGYSGGDSGDSGPAATPTAVPGANTDIYLKTDSDYLAKHSVVPADIVIMSYSGGGWQELPTKFVYSSGNDFYFTADADSYSLLAIGNTKDGVSGLPVIGYALAPTTAMETAARVTPALSSPERPQATYQKTGIPAAQQTTAVPAGAQAPAGSSGFPVTTVALIGAGCVVLVGTGWYIRRWWIRRQNPALFKKYD